MSSTSMIAPTNLTKDPRKSGKTEPQELSLDAHIRMQIIMPKECATTATILRVAQDTPPTVNTKTRGITQEVSAKVAITKPQV